MASNPFQEDCVLCTTTALYSCTSLLSTQRPSIPYTGKKFLILALFCCCDKHHGQKHHMKGRGLFQSAGYSPSLREVKAGAQRQAYLLFYTTLPLTKELTSSQGYTTGIMVDAAC